MTGPDPLLFFTVIAMMVATVYLILTAPNLTAEERKEMEDDWP
jgi:hypothetical protein